MTHCLQIFVYKAMEGDNNFPLLYFDTLGEKHEFVRNLKSIPRQRLDKPHFVLNNPQLLPYDIRNLHVYEAHINTLDSPQQGVDMRDGIFVIEDNIDIFQYCKIDNNTLEETGFAEYILHQTFGKGWSKSVVGAPS